MKIARRSLTVAIAAAVISVASAAGRENAAAASCTMPTGNSAQQWDAIATSTVLAAGPFQIEGFLYMAYANGAMYDAAVSILGGYRPYLVHIPAPPDANADAAIANASYDTLLHYFPAQAATLGCYHDLALAAIADSAGKTNGEAVGDAASAVMISARGSDGRFPIGTIMPSFPAAAPGVWQPTPPAFLPPQTPWAGQVKPFILRSPDQYLPPPPPKLSSKEWAKEFNEVKLWGAATGSPRSQEQTDIARFWSTNTVAQYNQAFRDVATQHSMSLVDTARLIGEGSLVASDAGIACLNAKYHYWFWRPVTAINATDPAVTDGNPSTIEQHGWTPLLVTPNHPEYPAAHGCVSSAMAAVFTDVLGTQNINLTLTGTVVPTMPTRTFATADALREEIINARLWGGLHYRGSTEAGEKLGEKVAHFDLEHAFKPEH